MRLRVSEHGGEVHVDVDGVAGRQQRVLLALTECQRLACGPNASFLGDVSIRAGADRMHIRLKGREGLRLEALAVYQCLRAALTDRSAAGGTATSAS